MEAWDRRHGISIRLLHDPKETPPDPRGGSGDGEGPRRPKHSYWPTPPIARLVWEGEGWGRGEGGSGTPSLRGEGGSRTPLSAPSLPCHKKKIRPFVWTPSHTSLLMAPRDGLTGGGSILYPPFRNRFYLVGLASNWRDLQPCWKEMRKTPT